MALQTAKIIPITRHQEQKSAVQTWLKIREVEELGISRRLIFLKLQSREWESFEVGKSPNGKAIREILLQSLPHDLQVKYAKTCLDARTDFEAGDEPEGSLTNEIRLAQALQRYAPKVREAFRDEAIRLSKIVEKYAAIEPKRTPKNKHGKHDFVPEVWQLCEETICSDPTVVAVEPSRLEARSPVTLDGWWRKSKTKGLAVFLRKPSASTKSTNDKRLAQMSPLAVEWVNTHWRTFSSARALFRELKKKAKKSNWQIPSESWVYRNWQDIPNIVSTYVQEGSKKYTGKYAPYVPRTVADLEALQILCGDHSVRDISVCMPDGSLLRPWLTLWYCLRTGLIWGWHLDVSPSSVTAGLAYANGVKTFGGQPTARPESEFYSYLYTDQGRDYKSKTWDGKTLVFKEAMRIDGGLEIICRNREVGFFAETDIKHILARGYNAREKPVERVHRDISTWEQNTFSTEYCGRDAKNKPEKWVTAWHKHDKLRKKYKSDLVTLCQESPFMTLPDYREALEGFINEFNTIPHTRTVLGGRKVVPLEEFERIYTTRYEIDETALALLLMKTPDQPKNIGKNGVTMTFGGRKYDYLHPEMSMHKGTKVEIRYADDDLSFVWAVLPATNTKPVQIVKCDLVTPSSIINLNKKTAETIAKQGNSERKLIRDFQLLNQSKLRGESVEDRVIEAIGEVVEVEQIEMKQAANGGNVVRQMTRFDAVKVTNKRKIVTSDVFTNIEANNDIFADNEPQKPGKLIEWDFEK